MKWVLPEKDAGETEIDFPSAADTAKESRAKRKFFIPGIDDAVPDQDSLAESTLASYPAGQRMLIGAGSRLNDMGQGVKQLAGMVYNKVADEPVSWPDEVAEQTRANRPYKQAIARDTAANIGTIGTDILGGMAVGLPFGGSILGAGVAGGVLGGPLQPREEANFGSLLQDTSKAATAGAIGGGLTGLAMSGLGRAYNSSKGRFGSPDIARRYNQFKSEGVPGSLGDITQNPLVMHTENIAQYMPFTGRDDFLTAQADAVRNMVHAAPSKIVKGVASDSKEDIGNTLANSIRKRYTQNKNFATSLYNQVERHVQAANPPPVTPTQLAATAGRLRNEYPGVFDAFQDKRAVARLNSIIDSTAPQNSVILGPNGKPFTHPPAVNFEDMRWLDKRLGAMTRQADKQVMNGTMDPEAFRQLTSLQQALRSDVDNWSQAIGMPEIAQGVRIANGYFQKNVLPFRTDPFVRKIIKNDPNLDTDTIADKLFKLDSPTKTDTNKRLLTLPGYRAARYHLIKKAQEQAVKETMHPALRVMHRKGDTALGETGPKMFSKKELGTLQQKEDVLQAARRSLKMNSDPSENARLLSISAMLRPTLPLTARLFSTASNSDEAIRLMLANPRLSSRSGPLLRMTEEAARRSGIGPALDIEQNADEDF